MNKLGDGVQPHNESTRMLVILENGEQQLLTFPLLEEGCNVQEILEQVNVPSRLIAIFSASIIRVDGS
jgi:hypothetical protein